MVVGGVVSCVWSLVMVNCFVLFCLFFCYICSTTRRWCTPMWRGVAGSLCVGIHRAVTRCCAGGKEWTMEPAASANGLPASPAPMLRLEERKQGRGREGRGGKKESCGES